MNRFVIFLSTILFCFHVVGQSSDIQQEQWRDALIEIMDTENNEQDINIVIERLSELINNPILINICTKQELEQVPFLSDKQVENLLYYLYVYGEMKSLHELRMVEGFDLNTIQLVTPFFRVEPVGKSDSDVVKNLLGSVRQQILFRYDTALNKKEGYVDKSDSILAANPNKQYLGSPFYYGLRYRLESRDKLKIGFILEKDPGEKGVDYLNGFIQIKNRGILRNLVTGSYKLRFGSGLVMNNAFSLGKNSLGAESFSKGSSITPHASTDEFNYLQGMAAEIRTGRITWMPFWSFRNLDARRDGDTILSLKKDGLHRILSDKEKRRQANMITTGMHAGLRGGFYEVGLSGCYSVFNKTYAPMLTLYNRYYFRGKRNYNLAADYRIRYAGLSFSGETAVGSGGGVATLNMLGYSPGSDFSVLLIQRYYGKSYHSWFAKSYSEGSELNNESGFSLYLAYNPIPFLNLKGGLDFFRFSWPKYGINIPSSGYELSFQGIYQQSEKTAFTLRYRLKNKDKNRSGMPDSVASVQRYQQHTLNLRLRSCVGEIFFLNTGIEAVVNHFEKEKPAKGFLLSQSMGCKLPRLPFQADFAIALFDTDNTVTRVYLSEKNILYGFGIPSFYGNGMRYSFHIRYDYSSLISCWIKLANTRYFDREEIGSGMELIRGKSKTDLWAQIQVKF